MIQVFQFMSLRQLLDLLKKKISKRNKSIKKILRRQVKKKRLSTLKFICFDN